MQSILCNNVSWNERICNETWLHIRKARDVCTSKTLVARNWTRETKFWNQNLISANLSFHWQKLLESSASIVSVPNINKNYCALHETESGTWKWNLKRRNDACIHYWLSLNSKLHMSCYCFDIKIKFQATKTLIGWNSTRNCGKGRMVMCAIRTALQRRRWYRRLSKCYHCHTS